MINADIKSWNLIDCSANGTIIAIASNGGYVYITASSGNIWFRASSLGSNEWNSISVSSSGSRIIVSTRRQIFISTNTGSSWSEITFPGSGSQTETINGVAISPDGTKILVSTNIRPYTSNNLGSSWILPSDNRNILPLQTILDVRISRVQIQNNGSFTAHNTFFDSSTNTIKTVRTIIGADNTSALGSFDYSTMVVSVGSYSYISYNKGTTFSEIVGLTDGNGLSSVSNDGQVIIHGRTGTRTFAISRNRGISWSNKSLPSSLLGFVLSKDGTTICAICDGVAGPNVFITTNDGSTWNSINTNTGGNWTTLSCSKLNGGLYVAVAAYDGYIFLSTDYGSQWTQLDNAGKRSWAKVIISEDGNTILALHRGSPGLFDRSGLMRTTNAGATWTTIFQTTGYDPNIDFSCSRDMTTIAIVSVNNRRVIVSRNSGTSFQNSTVPNTLRFYSGPNSPSADFTSWRMFPHIYVSADGFFIAVPIQLRSFNSDIAIISSSNNGVSWNNEVIRSGLSGSYLITDIAGSAVVEQFSGSANGERFLINVVAPNGGFLQRLDYLTKVGSNYARSCSLSTGFRPILTGDGLGIIDCVTLPKGTALFGDAIHDSSLSVTKAYIVNNLGEIYTNNNQCGPIL